MVTVVDYSQYTQSGFFLSESNAVSFEYESTGSLQAYIRSGIHRYPEIRIATMDDAVRVLYEKSVDLKADGIINLKFELVKNGVIATGMAIKRK
jgi:uncharacterized protein YbjQ (UPF0145 family)